MDETKEMYQVQFNDEFLLRNFIIRRNEERTSTEEWNVTTKTANKDSQLKIIN